MIYKHVGVYKVNETKHIETIETRNKEHNRVCLFYQMELKSEIVT